MPFLRFRIGRALDGGDLSTIEGRARAAEAALDVVREHPDPLVRDQYVVEIADRTRIDLHRLREMAAGERARAPTPDRFADERPAERLRLTPEDEAIRLLIHRPDEATGRVVPNLFGDPVRREAVEALVEDGVLAAADRVGDRAAGLLRRLAVETSDAEPEDVIAGLVRTAAERVLRDLQRQARVAVNVDDRQAYAAAIAWVKTRTEGLSERGTREPNVEQLLPWLIEHAEGGAG